MNCKWVVSRLSCFLDGELSSAELRTVRSHLADCADCRHELEAYRYLKQAVSSWPTPEPPTGFEERLCQAVFAHESVPAKRRLSLAWAGGAAFAAAFLGATLWLQSNRTQQLQAEAQMARSGSTLARDQAYASGADPLSGASVMLTSSNGIR